MYLPENFKVDDVPILHATIRQIAFGTLVTQGSAGMEASHVPMLIDPEPGPFGTLHGHISRANPQWERLAAGSEALAMFVGPQGYITPSWYATKRATGKVVPTWNYVAIHVYGRPTFFDDAERLRKLVTRLTATHEAPRAAPWAVTDAPASFIDGMLRAIVGFELPIERLEGKWKMSQNRPEEDRRGVLEGLAREGGPREAAVAETIRAANRD
ncbi:MAG TPA: FMN-binding negative transcriptional regulator [Stellaceae bacterium]|nr:FMN-binding negative transcriptional regulator [Stellaceae bacterium]